MANKNKAKTWKYGYNEKYKLVIISRNGTLGDIYEISNVIIGLPKTPKSFNNQKEKKENQVWLPTVQPKVLKRICPGVFGTIHPTGYCMIGKK